MERIEGNLWYLPGVSYPVMTHTVHQWVVGWHTLSFMACITIQGTDSHPPEPPDPSPPGPTHSWNLFGRPGDGYYTQVEVGTPPQKVRVEDLLQPGDIQIQA